MALSPARFGLLVDAWNRREQRQDRRFGLIACVLANINRGQDQDPFEVDDFIPKTKAEQAKAERAKDAASQQRLAAYLQSMTTRTGKT